MWCGVVRHGMANEAALLADDLTTTCRQTTAFYRTAVEAVGVLGSSLGFAAHKTATGSGWTEKGLGK